MQAQGVPSTSHAPMQQPVSTTQQVAPPPAFQGKMALFPNTKPGAKSAYSGRLSLPAQQLPAILHYLQTTPPNERGDIEFWLTGFDNVSRTGQQYIGGYVAPQQVNQGLAVQHANQQLQASPAVQQQFQQPAPPVQPTAWVAPQGQSVQGNPPF